MPFNAILNRRGLRLSLLCVGAFLTALPTIGQHRPSKADSIALYQRHIDRTPDLYRYERHFLGDCNNDRRPDVVVIARKSQPEPGAPRGGFARRAVLLINEPNGQLKLAAYNDQVVRCTTCGEGSMNDPLQRVNMTGLTTVFVSRYGIGQPTSEFIGFVYDKKDGNWWLSTLVTQKFEYDASGRVIKGYPQSRVPAEVHSRSEAEVIRPTYPSCPPGNQQARPLIPRGCSSQTGRRPPEVR